MSCINDTMNAKAAFTALADPALSELVARAWNALAAADINAAEPQEEQDP